MTTRPLTVLLAVLAWPAFAGTVDPLPMAVVGALALWLHRRSAPAPAVRIRWVGVVPLLVALAGETARSVARLVPVVVGLQRDLQEAVVDVALVRAHAPQDAIVAYLVTFTPGTIVLVERRTPTVLRIHAMRAGAPDEIRTSVLRFEDLVVAAFPLRQDLGAAGTTGLRDLRPAGVTP